ncbi:GLI4 isoform 9, partial [Pongo abelii]
TPGAQHHEPQLHLHGHQHGSPGSSPKVLSQPSDLDLQDVEEVEIGRDTFWPGPGAAPASGLNPARSGRRASRLGPSLAPSRGAPGA